MCLRISAGMKIMTRKNKKLSHICLFPLMGIYLVSLIHCMPEECLAVLRKKVLRGQNLKTFYHSFKTDL